jgi:CubicO group peptidase (beta-lactamase class C family)
VARTNRIQTWLAVIVGAIGLLLAALAGLWAYMSATPPLHPDPGSVRTVAGAAGAPEWRDAAGEARQIVRATLAEQNWPGVSVAVGMEGGLVWAEGFGWADIETRVAVTPDTRFRIGTASMMLTSAAVGLLVEQGRLNLEETIQTHVPAFPEKPWPVTLRQVMAHTAGIGSDGGDESPLYGQHCDQAVDGIDAFKDDALLFEPGTAFRYSRFGWIAVSAAVERAAEEPFMRFMRRQIFEPLGMENTRPESATESIPGRATFYFPRFAAEPRYGPDVMRDLDYSCYSGAAAFLSTPSDLVRFALAVNEGRLLKPATVQLLQSPQRLPSGGDSGYGLGWDLETVALHGRNTRAVGHDGDALGGMVASSWTFPEHGIVVALTSNISYADTFALASKLAEVFAERKPLPAS